MPARQKLFPLLFYLLLFGVTRITPAETVLPVARDNQPQAVIIIGQKATDTEQFAARELQIYIARSSSAFLPVAVEKSGSNDVTELVVGSPGSFSPAFGLSKDVLPEEGPLSDQAYRIKTVGKRVYLIGNSPRSALWASYTFLEKAVGIRWIKPGNDGEVIPPRLEISFPEFDKTYRPSFAIRGWHPCWGVYSKTDIYLWLARNRMNLVSSWGPKPALCKLLGLDTMAGGHVLGDQAVSAELFSKHPEYFALINGKRNPASDHRCLSNPEVRKLVIDYIGKTVCDNDIYTLLMPDLTRDRSGINGTWCECPDCRAFDPSAEMKRGDEKELRAKGILLSAVEQEYLSDRLISYQNLMAGELSKEFPKTVFPLPAYSDYIMPPLTNTPDQRWKYILYCDHSRCWVHGYQDTICPHNEVKYKDRIKKWAGFGKPLIFYAYFNSSQGEFRPWAFAVSQDMQFLKSIGGAGWFTESMGEDYIDHPKIAWNKDWVKFTKDWFKNKATYYTAVRSLWDADLNHTDILDDMYRAMYGPAGTSLKDAYLYVENLYRSCSCGGSVSRLLTEENAKELKNLLQKAAGSVPEEDGALRFKVKREIAVYDELFANLKSVPENTISVKRVPVAPGLQAKFDDEFWNKFSAHRLIPDEKPESRDKVEKVYAQKPEFKICYDQENLYLRVILNMRSPEKLKMVSREKDGDIFGEVPVEIFIRPDEKSFVYYHFAVSPANAVYDARCVAGNYFYPEWNSSLRSTSKVTGNIWVTDIAIPLNSFGGKITPGQKLNIMVYRDGEVSVGWPYPGRHKLDEFGTITFGEEPAR